jgi:hypothetical protein
VVSGSGSKTNDIERAKEKFLSRLGGDFGHERYNPVYDRLDEGSVIEDWIPRDAPGIHMMMRRIYTRDEIGGPMVDIFKEMAWSDYDLHGVKDPHMMEPFALTSRAIDLQSLMPALSAENLIIGRAIYSLGWDSQRGIFSMAVPHDPDFVRIWPVPIHGVEPFCDLRASPTWRQFAVSDDPRMTELRSVLPPSIIQALQSSTGFVPMDPVTTLFCIRKSSSYDYIGTSLFTRLINFIAIQKPLLDATAVTLRRRASGVMHIRAGNERWEANDQDLSDLAALWMQAEEDQGGGIVVTRDGVETERGQSGQGDTWKLSDEWSFLSEGKMRSLGISEAFLSGDANYSNAEMALSVFLERLRGFREHLTSQVIYRKLFHTIARAHGFIKPEKNSPQSRRQAWMMSHKSALKIPPERLIFPELKWHKSLHPVGDESYLSILDRLKEAGLPVTKAHYAAHGGFDIKRAMSMLEDDVAEQQVINNWQAALQQGQGGAEGGDQGAEGGQGQDQQGQDQGQEEGAFARVRIIPHPLRKTPRAELRTAAPKALDSLGFWDKQKKFCGLRRADAQKALDKVLPKLHKQPPPKMVLDESGLRSPHERKAFHYLLVRLGFLPGYKMGETQLREVATHIAKCLPLQRAHPELEILAKACAYIPRQSHQQSRNQQHSAPKPQGVEKLLRLPQGPEGRHLLSGHVDPTLSTAAPTLSTPSPEGHSK